MTTTTLEPISALYLTDETAWLEAMAARIEQRDFADLDYENLKEYLTDMAIRDKREVISRLTVLIAHHLKCQFQRGQRNTAWIITILKEQVELEQIFESKVLRRHAENKLSTAYRFAVQEAAIETGLPESAFPEKSKFTSAEWVALPVPE